MYEAEYRSKMQPLCNPWISVGNTANENILW